MEEMKPKFQNVVYRSLRDFKSIKLQVNVHVHSELEYTEKILNSAKYTIINRHQFGTTYTRVSSQIDGLINSFERFGSNWVVDSIQGMDIVVGIFRPFQAACYVRTPLYI
jgi:hypothetical protein